MSSTNKSISIDPEMFKIKNTTTRKTRKKSEGTGSDDTSPKIKFKQKPPSTSIKRRKILEYIRKKQNANYNSILSQNNTVHRGDPSDPNSLPKGEFEESLNFLKEIQENSAKETPNTLPIVPLLNQPTALSTLGTFPPPISSSFSSSQHTPLNYTIKNHPFSPHENVALEFPSLPSVTDIVPSLPVFKIAPPPGYGVLKGGKLPTYRQFMRTQSHRESPITSPVFTPTPLNAKENEIYHRANMVNAAVPEKKVKTKLYFPKQKKTVRRTFRVGRSKYHPKIGVIINNRTIRDECTTRKHVLKQTPIGDVKRFLIKKGLIKVGSTAPNDVLRKMYESANMICGDVQNHNSDILLHNYFNNAKE